MPPFAVQKKKKTVASRPKQVGEKKGEDEGEKKIILFIPPKIFFELNYFKFKIFRTKAQTRTKVKNIGLLFYFIFIIFNIYLIYIFFLVP